MSASEIARLKAEEIKYLVDKDYDEKNYKKIWECWINGIDYKKIEMFKKYIESEREKLSDDELQEDAMKDFSALKSLIKSE